MEFYLHNKDDRKSSTLVNLGTTFKIDDINYIVYFNTQVEKSMIDIYIGKISYGDQCLVINKIDSDKQAKFLDVVKSILAGNNPETEFGDYDNIIDTASIVLETVQKIQIPTNSLDNIKNYHKNINDSVVETEEVSKEKNSDVEEKSDESKPNIDNNEKELEDTTSNKNIEETSKTTNNNESISNSLSFDDKLSSLNETLNERKEKEEKKSKKEKKAISTPILVLLIIVVIGSAILYFVGNGLE